MIATLILSLLLTQTPWEAKTVQGYSLYQGNLDDTEGFGAYMDLPLKPLTRNFDNGGGTHDYNSKFLSKYYGVENQVYDPFQRTEQENVKVLSKVHTHTFDTSTSMSVLNVIDTLPARLNHIFLSCEAIKAFGTAYFKIFENNGTGKEEWNTYGYQANRPTQEFQKEVEGVFGKGNVVTDTVCHLLIAYKNSDCTKPSDPQS